MSSQLPALDSELASLPHRSPFVFVKKLLAIQPGISADCTTWFEHDDPMFAGHFPGNPLVPGVIITEALAQSAGIAAASGYPETKRPLFLLSAIRRMKFPRPARPGDCIHLRADRLAEVQGLVQFAVRATVEGVSVAEGQIVLAVSSQPEGDERRGERSSATFL
ncbi:MAG TPA: 3-hydroxyacyl-ACP dehydratase FabZ family protein [Chthoniobacterales bacterium]|nr:3-hydroxyacyl-ACP dehydratase FabZ family protein [Chthoniobacterales bacterium]